MQNRTIKRSGIALAAVALVLNSGCYSGGNNPGIEYSPNMYVSEAYEAYTQTGEMEHNPYGMTMREPVPGTVAQGQLGYLGYPEGYEASATWSNPLAPTHANVDAGMVLYNRNCQHCHGMKGKNDGGVIKSGQYPPPPWSGYDDAYIKSLPDGKVFHTITHGKGNMGSHASVLTPAQRWQVVWYVRSLSLGDAFQYAEEGAAAPVATSNDIVSAKPAWLTGFEFADVDATEYRTIWGAMQNVKFDNIRYRKMKDDSKPYLDQVATYLTNHPELKAVVVGHISSDTDAGAIQDGLSEIRAKAVCDYLTEKGIDGGRLSAKGAGADHPIASNDTKEGREQNRRVEIYFVK